MTENLTRNDARFRSDNISVETYDVSLDVTREDSFDTAVTVCFTSKTEETFLDFIGEAVEKVQVNGEDVDVVWDGARISLTGLVEHNVVRVEGRGTYSRSGEGLHRFVDPVDGEVYLYTQYEPADCRRVFPNFEQPDLKAVFTFTVTAPAHWVVLTNKPESRREVQGETVTVSFEPTETQSTYLTALVAGPYFEVRSDKDERFAAYCRKSLAEHFDYDEIFDISLAGLPVFEKAFGCDYPWGKYDQAFVPEYNLGAMENPGLVTFTESYIFRGQSTRAQHMGRANTILHEMSHMWFGDLVTPVWWDDLWLKESFAEFMGAWASVEATKFSEAWVAFTGSRSGWAFLNDMRPTTHPIVADIPDLEAADQNFDGITYAKGAAVLRQLVTFVGEEEFFAGTRLYFEHHQFGNAGLSDLLAALEETSGRDLKDWANQWLQTSGASVLRYDNGTITQTGHDPKTGEKITRPHRFSVGAYSLKDGVLTRTDSTMVELTDSVEVGLSGDLILPNDEGQTYGIVRLDEAGTKAVLSHHIDDPLARAVAWMGLWQAVRDGELDPIAYLEGVARASNEPDSALLANMLANCHYLVEHYVVDTKAAYKKWFEIAAQAWLKATAEGAEDRTYLWLGAMAYAARGYDGGDEILVEALSSVDDDVDQQWKILIARAATGQVDEAELETYLVDPTEADIVAHMTAVAAIPANRLDAYGRALSEDLSNDRLSALLEGATVPFEGREYPFFDIALDVWNTRSQEIAQRILYALFPGSEEAIAAGHAWLDGEGQEAPAALRKIVIDGVDSRERDARVRRVSSL